MKVYHWASIVRGAAAKHTWSGRLRHVAYAAGWKKFEPLWDFIIRLRRVTVMLPLLETILSEFGKRQAHNTENFFSTSRRSAISTSG